MYEIKDWKDSEFEKVVRIKKEDLEFLKKEKGKKTIAGMLSFIINFYKENGPKKLQSNQRTKQL